MCRVVAINQRGESPPGHGAGAFMPRLAGAPTQPLYVETSLLNDYETIAVTWDSPIDNGGEVITGYEVLIKIK